MTDLIGSSTKRSLLTRKAFYGPRPPRKFFKNWPSLFQPSLWIHFILILTKFPDIWCLSHSYGRSHVSNHSSNLLGSIPGSSHCTDGIQCLTELADLVLSQCFLLARTDWVALIDTLSTSWTICLAMFNPQTMWLLGDAFFNSFLTIYKGSFFEKLSFLVLTCCCLYTFFVYHWIF